MGGEFQGISTKWIGARLQGPGITLLNLHRQVGCADFNRAGDKKQVSGFRYPVSGFRCRGNVIGPLFVVGGKKKKAIKSSSLESVRSRKECIGAREYGDRGEWPKWTICLSLTFRLA